jgi:hypothetical protein
MMMRAKHTKSCSGEFGGVAVVAGELYDLDAVPNGSAYSLGDLVELGALESDDFEEVAEETEGQ